MSKLYRARSLLYRRQILQVNIRWKALDEIYKIYMLLHRSDLNISEVVRQTFSVFSQKLISWVFNDQPCECADVGQWEEIGRPPKIGWEKK